jgi:DNA-binding PadR family transcriptional regulator
MAKGVLLGEFEQLMLLAILRLGDNAYGVSIRREIEVCARRAVASGAIYATLERMLDKGYISGKEGEPEPTRGGRPKVYYHVEAPGLAALSAWDETQRRMRHGLNLAQVLR